MKDRVVATLFGTGDDGLETVFLQPIVRIQRIDGFGRFADNDKNLIHMPLPSLKKKTHLARRP